MGIRDRPVSPRSPWQNGYAERLIGSIRRECVDHVVVLGERHRHLLLSYNEILQRNPHTPVIEQGRANLARCRGGWAHSLSADLGRIASSLQPDLIYDRHRSAKRTGMNARRPISITCV